jgi:hypothetical protein
MSALQLSRKPQGGRREARGCGRVVEALGGEAFDERLHATDALEPAGDLFGHRLRPGALNGLISMGMRLNAGSDLVSAQSGCPKVKTDTINGYRFDH